MPLMAKAPKKKKTRDRKPDPNSKRSLGVDRHTKPRVVFHVEQALMDAMIAYRQSASPKPSLTAALVAATQDFLRAKGFWPPTTTE